MDITNLNFLNSLIRKNAIRAVESILESRADSDERKKQKDLSSFISKRGLKASEDKSKDVDEVEKDSDSNVVDKKPGLEKKEKEKREDRTGGKGTADSVKAKTPKEKVFKDPSLVDFVNKINVLRGGKSVDSPSIKKALSSYLDSLSTGEKRSMLVFLTAVSQIMVGKKQGADALDPEEAGIKTAIQKPIEKTISQKNKSASKVGTEKVPIVVGEVANKEMVRKILEKYKGMK